MLWPKEQFIENHWSGRRGEGEASFQPAAGQIGAWQSRPETPRTTAEPKMAPTRSGVVRADRDSKQL